MIRVIEQNEDFDVIELSNEHIIAKVTNYGCTILSLKVKNKYGQWQDVVIGFKSVEDYMKKDGSYLGAVVGRVANRIEKGQFKVNGLDYQLDINNGPNTLHGGIDGFSYQRFDYQLIGNGVLFNYFSKDGDQHFPGNLDLFVIYTIDDANFSIQYQAMCDKDTVINITNHSYFNLNGSGSVENHQLLIHSDQVGLTDCDGLLKGELIDVKETDFDVNTYTPLSKIFDSHHPAIKQCNGLDNSYIFNRKYRQVKLYSPDSGIRLQVETTYPCVQIYTANGLHIDSDANGNTIGCHDAIAIETQYLPNSMNWQENSPTYLRKEKLFHEKTILNFKVKE